jgi:DNA anti-recombination protein RmuC
MSSTPDIRAKAQEISDRAGQIKAQVSETMAIQQQKMKESLAGVQDQLQAYGSQIGEYLNSIDANVEHYRFAVEKSGDNGLTIDVLFKATITQKDSTV